MAPFNEIDLDQVRTYPTADRPSKVHVDQQARSCQAGATVAEFFDGLPDILKVIDLKRLAHAIIRAKQKKKPIIVMMGGHVIKTGCAPVLIDLAENGYITHLASNGSAAIHDTELARFGHTSEEVGSQLCDGSFGMARDTAQLVNNAAREAQSLKVGFGESVGALLEGENPPHIQKSIIAGCYRLQIPYTLHVAIGTDIVHQHASADGSAIGEASFRDFRILASTVSRIGNGGVVLNLGSAVIMPEVFLKCLAIARNLDRSIQNFTTANFDMIQHYRPTVNVLQRPVTKGGDGFAFTGHHEIMIPLLAALIYETQASLD